MYPVNHHSSCTICALYQELMGLSQTPVSGLTEAQAWHCGKSIHTGYHETTNATDNNKRS